MFHAGDGFPRPVSMLSFLSRLRCLTLIEERMKRRASLILMMALSMLSLFFAMKRWIVFGRSEEPSSVNMAFVTIWATVASDWASFSSMNRKLLRVVTKEEGGGSKGVMKIVSSAEERNRWWWVSIFHGGFIMGHHLFDKFVRLLLGESSHEGTEGGVFLLTSVTRWDWDGDDWFGRGL